MAHPAAIPRMPGRLRRDLHGRRRPRLRPRRRTVTHASQPARPARPTANRAPHRKWAGHSVEVLTRIYAGCVVGLDEVWIARMSAGLRPGNLTSGNESGGSEVTGWGAAGVRQPADHGTCWRILAEAMDGNGPPSWLVTTGFAWSSGGAPSRIRTCAHGSGVRLPDLANLCHLPGWTRSLIPRPAKIIPEIVQRSGQPQYDQARYQVGYAVEDIDAAREQLISLGVQVVSDLEGSASAGGRWCYFRDAEGNVFELKERRTGA
jgi:hypothetical protein